MAGIDSEAVFFDTGYAIALLDATDIYHGAAKRWARRTRTRPYVTTTAVLTELGDGFASPAVWPVFREFLERLVESPRARILDVPRNLFDRVVALRDMRTDKGWGITDSISFVTMVDFGLKEALAADRHFVQAGFRALLLEE